MHPSVNRNPRLGAHTRTGKGKGSAGGAAAKKTRTGRQAKGPRSKIFKTFATLLDEAMLDQVEGPTYLTAVVPPPRYPVRKFCSVCGQASPYNCVRCGMRFCTRRCFATHKDTRCLKFTE